MITTGPELDRFVVEPCMEIEPFDPKLIKEIFLNHPYKILLFHLNKHPSTTADGKMKTSMIFTSKCWMTIIDMKLVLIAKIIFFLIKIYM